MDKIKSSKSKVMPILAIAIIVIGYAVNRVIGIVTTLDKTQALIMAIAYTVLLAVTYFLISKTDNFFYALLASLLGYKMMPPEIPALNAETLDGSMLYYIVRRVAVVLFVILIVKSYELQEKPRAVKPLPILSMMIVVPFFTEIGAQLAKYMLISTNNMLYAYFAQFITYSIAAFVILMIAYTNNYESMRFTAYFEFLALAINALRRVAVIVMLLAQGEHVSKSYYVWIVIYAFFALLFLLAKNKKKALEQ